MPGHTPDTSDQVRLPPGLVKRFYGSIVLLNTLNDCLPQTRNRSSTPSELEREVGSDPAGLLRCFVNKLAQICDSKRGGDTVTAIAILQPGCIEYRLSSNNRTKNQFMSVKVYLAGILGSLGDASAELLTDDSLVAELCSDILTKVLAFNDRRIKVYVTAFLQNVEFCIGSCDDDGRPEARSAARYFRELQPFAEAAEEQWRTANFARDCRALLHAIKERYQDFKTFLRTMARDDQGPSDVTPWTELRQAISRLHSYSIAMDVFVDARKRWPELFDKGFEITHVPSAPRRSNPIQMKQLRCNGHDILGILNAKDGVKQAYRECARHYSTIDVDLDNNILKQIKDPNYTTCVHAEVNVASSIGLEEHDPNAEEPVRFFKEDSYGKYIGCSKPTCLLCSLYLDELPMRFERRPRHGNLYTKWRAPDIFLHGNTELTETRRLIVEGMVTKLTRIISNTILTRTGMRIRHDSRQTPTDPFRSLRSVSVRTSAGRTYVASEAGINVDERITEHESSQSSDAEGDDVTDSESLTELVQVVTDLGVVGGHVSVKHGGGDEGSDDESDGGGASI